MIKFGTSIVITLLVLVSTVAEAHNVRDIGEHGENKRHYRAKEGKIRNEKHHHDHRRKDDPSARIIGGSQSDEIEFPYYVDTRHCGGSLIAPKVVLTAAHCKTDLYPDNKVIVNGYETFEVGTYGIVRTVMASRVHPQYERGVVWQYDVQLYLLNEPAIGLSVTLTLNQDANYPPDGTDVTSLGQGCRLDQENLINELFLHDVVMQISNIDECVDHWEHWKPKKKNRVKPEGLAVIPDRHICAGVIGKGTCSGDSGTPLVVRQNEYTHIQVGVVNGGDHTRGKASTFDNVFARTSYYMDWIKSVVCDEWQEEADFCD